MKTTLNVSSRGVVTLPAKLRAAFGIGVDDFVIAEATPEGILLRPAVTLPVEIYAAKRIEEFDSAESDLAKAMANKSPNKASLHAKTAKTAKAVTPARKPRRAR